MTLNIYCDGGARGNPGPAAIGFAVKNQQGKTLYQHSQFIGHTTNNVAEYQAVIAALTWIKENSQPSIHNYQFFLDSSLVVNQLNGFFKVKNAALRDLIVKVRQLEQEIKLPITYTYIPRTKNKLADHLVNQALDRFKS